MNNPLDQVSSNEGASRPRKFQPFYEAIPAGLPGPPLFIWKVGVSVALGAVFLIVLFVATGKGVFTGWLWLVCLLITASQLALYYATDTLRRLFPHMDSRLHQRGKPFTRATQPYYRTVRKRLSDRNFVAAGMLFGALNCGMGLLFGLPDTYSRWGRVAIFSCFFVVGFVCGMAVLGIYGVLEIVKDFVRTPHLELDYSAPDGCGGMRFLGEALVKFGSVTLVGGVLIALFIVKFAWANEQHPVIRGFQWFWIAWPFFLSLIVVLGPSAEISGVLADYKVERQDELDERLATLRKEANDASPGSAERDAARKDYDYYSKQREEVYKMSTWPYGISSSVTYVGILIANGGSLFMTAVQKMITR